MLILHEISYLGGPVAGGGGPGNPGGGGAGTVRQFVVPSPMGPLYVNVSASADRQFNGSGVLVNEQS